MPGKPYMPDVGSNAIRLLNTINILEQDSEETLEKITSRLSQENVRHEVHKFDSGAVMVDVWKGDLFYVIQIEDKMIGLSLVKDNTAFDTIPDKAYSDFEAFKIEFEKIFG